MGMDLPQNWKYLNFEKCINRVSISNSLKIPKRDYQIEGDIPIIDQGKDFIAGYCSDKAEVFENVPVIIFGDHTCVFKYIDFPFLLGADGTKIISPKTELLVPKYFYYYLRTIKLENPGYSRHYKYLKDKFIVIPPKSVQLKISEKLESIEKLIYYRKESLKLTNLFLNSIFNEMFLKKDFKEDILKKYTSLITSGSTPRGGSENYTTEGDILFIRSQNVLMNEFSTHDSLYISSEIHNNMKRTWLKNKDVLLNITGASIGRTVVYQGLDDKANLNQHVCIIRLNDFNIINPIFLNYYFSSHIIQDHIKKINAGATREALNFTQIGNFKIILPPIELQNQFAKIVLQVEETKKYQLESKKELENLFNNLMQKVFKGELIC